jgi:class 3 adenylate cyclase
VPPAGEERKVVTVLFCDLVGFTERAGLLDPEDVRAIQAPYFARLRRELEQRGGTVEKFIGDAVMALFGAPRAFEDDPERAVRAALAIRDWAAEQEGLLVRIAVTTGEALVNLAAQPLHGEGMASGDVVNTASRLQTAAPANGVLVDETTYRATKQLVEYRRVEPVAAKGKVKSISVWEAVQARAPVRPERDARAPFVGRHEELSLLEETFRRSPSSVQLVTLFGVPGIGKSRLVHEFAQAIERTGTALTWRQGRSLPYGAGVTLWALGEIVKAQAGILESDDREEAEEKLGLAVAATVEESEDASWVLAHLRSLVAVSDEDDLQAIGAPRLSPPGGASSRRWRESNLSSSSSRTCTGPTTRSSTSSSTSSSGRPTSPSSFWRPRGPNCSSADQAGREYELIRGR